METMKIKEIMMADLNYYKERQLTSMKYDDLEGVDQWTGALFSVRNLWYKFFGEYVDEVKTQG